MKIVSKIYLLVVVVCLPVLAFAQTATIKYDGVLKTKLEFCPQDGLMRFNIRNSRVGLRGNIGEYLSVRMQVELSNTGIFQPLDLNATLNPTKNISFLLGQQLVPFENSYMINPGQMIFANRAFLGAFFTPGARDIGAVGQYRFRMGNLPMEAQAGIFNGGKINDPQWTDKPSYAFRLIAGSMDGFRSTAKIYRYTGNQLDLLFWGADLRYVNNRLRIETEFTHRHTYTTGLNLWGTYIQGAYTFKLPDAKMFHCLTPALRWDGMGYDVWNNNFDVQRVTVGIMLGLTFIPFDSLLRIDCEQFIKRKDLHIPDFDNKDPHIAENMWTLELVIRF